MRDAIRSGTYRETALPEPQTADGYTLDAYAEIFLERYSKARVKVSWRDDGYRLNRVCAFTQAKGSRLGSRQIGAVTEDDVEAFLQRLTRQGRAASTYKPLPPVV